MARSINGLEPAIDFQHCQEDINRIATSIKTEREMLEAARDAKAPQARPEALSHRRRVMLHEHRWWATQQSIKG